MTTRYLISAPKRLKMTWNWFSAFYEFDFNYPEHLAMLICDGEIPPEYRSAVADIVTGERQPNKKAAAKLKVHPGDIMTIAVLADMATGHVDLVHEIGDFDKFAEREQKDVADVIKEMHERGRSKVANMAERENISTETIEEYAREMRKRIDRWPVV